MSNPSFSNIDLWLFELAEGNLTPAQIEQLELFLLQHPELDVDRDVWEMAKVAPVATKFAEQGSLRKKRPVGWYAIGATSAVAIVAVLWLIFPFENVVQQQSSRVDTKFTGARVLVMNGDADGVQTTATSDENFSSQGLLDVTASLPDLSQSHSNTAASQSSNTHFIAESNSNRTFGVSVEPISQQLGSQGSVNVNGVDAQSNAVNTQVASGTNGTNSSLNRESFEVVNEMIPMAIQRPIAIAENREPLDQLSFDQVNVTSHLQTNDQAIAESNRGKSDNGNYGMATSDYKVSFKSRLNSVGRKIQRMMDNPVALKNFRDPYYHVPGMLPNDLNFSATGTMLSTRVQAASRLQWHGQVNEQLQSQLAIDGYAYALRGGIGLQVNHTLYNNGGVNVASAAVTYSPKLSISRVISVEPSVRFKMGNKSLTQSKMEGVERVEIQRGNDFDFYPEGGIIGKQMWYHDLGVGLMVNTEWFFVGAQLDNLFRHRDNIYAQNFENPRRAGHHFVATIGTDWVSRKENLSLSPYLVYQNNERLSEAWLGANFRWNWFTLGGGISSNMEPAGSIGLKFDHFALTYNADYVESAMTGRSALSHQLTLRFVSKPSRFGRRLLNL